MFINRNKVLIVRTSDLQLRLLLDRYVAQPLSIFIRTDDVLGVGLEVDQLEVDSLGVLVFVLGGRFEVEVAVVVVLRVVEGRPYRASVRRSGQGCGCFVFLVGRIFNTYGRNNLNVGPNNDRG